jgi:hypothetical protein
MLTSRSVIEYELRIARKGLAAKEKVSLVDNAVVLLKAALVPAPI